MRVTDRRQGTSKWRSVVSHNPLQMAPTITSENWTSSWLDLVAFALGLGVAWWAGWNTGDLVWSLWLSSFVVGYSTIVWMIGQPAVALGWTAWRERDKVGANPRQIMIFLLIILGGASFLLAFFTIHFGGFHYGHSQFLISFFPVDLPGSGRASNAGMSTYIEVARRYWPFLPSAFLAHRAAFLRKPLAIGRDFSPAFERGQSFQTLFAEPYRNVLRMHVLIFFFFFAHFAHVENFAVYAVVYAVYFFPWRLVRKSASPTAPASVSLDT